MGEPKQHEVIHFLYCVFTGLGLHKGYRGDKWLRDRIRIFKQYTLPSIMNQTNKNFILWISWRPEDVNNPLVEELANTLEGMRDLQTIFTYGGCCFWDDKYENDNLLERLERTLPTIAKYMNYLPYSDKVLMTIQPSDDMYIDTAVEQVQDAYFKNPKKKAIGWKDGYIMNYNTRELAEYVTETIPPFFTVCFKREAFVDPLRHFKWTGPYISHEDIGKFMEYEVIDGRGFCVGTHGANISTTFNHCYQGKMIKGDEKENLLYAFNIYDSDPIVIRKSWRYVLRLIFNKIPYNERIRTIYNYLPNNLKRL